jgi:hypothetical protein
MLRAPSLLFYDATCEELFAKHNICNYWEDQI